jgi:hypothetical protein
MKGVDSLYIGFFGDVRKDLFYRPDIRSNQSSDVVINNVTFALKNESRGNYNKVLESEFMTVSFDNRLQVPYSPSVYVQMRSDFIHSRGIRSAYEHAREAVNYFYVGGVEDEKVSRVDLFADFFWTRGFNISHIKQFVTKARHKSAEVDGKKFSGFVVGKGNLKARIYNKTLEAEKSGKTWLNQVWGVDKPMVWRVEIQFRRGFLNTYGINTFDQLMASNQSLWDYATNDWLSMRIESNKNPTRRPVTSFWKEVRATVFNINEDAAKIPLSKANKIGMSDEQAIATVFGIMKNLAKKKNISIAESLEFLISKILQKVC